MPGRVITAGTIERLEEMARSEFERCGVDYDEARREARSFAHAAAGMLIGRLLDATMRDAAEAR